MQQAMDVSTLHLASRLARSHWDADHSVPIPETTIGDLLRSAAEAAPDVRALVAGVRDPAQRRSLSYREVLAASEDVAQVLLTRLEPGERLAVWAGSCVEWALVEFGAALAGLVLVPVNPAYTAAEARYVVEQSGAAGLLVSAEFRGKDLRAVAEELRRELPRLRFVMDMGSDSALWDSPSVRLDLPEVDSRSPAMMQFTSGTTGVPKGAVLLHNAVCNNSRLFSRRLGLPDGAVWLNPLPMFHIGGSSFCALGALWKRATHVITIYEPDLMLDLIESERPAFMPGVPTMVVGMLEHPTFQNRDLSSLEVVVGGSTVVPPEMVKQIENGYGCDFVPCFGQTEASGLIAQGHRNDQRSDKSGRVGRPLENVDVKVVDPVTGEVVGCGVVGEFCIRGYTVMQGYHDLPEATRSALDEDGWLHTGDLGIMDDRGYMQVTGRLKEMLIRGGENIYPREVEDVLVEHPDISEVAVFGLPDDYWGEQVAAVVRLTAGAAVRPDDWSAFVRTRLASHKVPRRWYITSAMPLTASGKIQKYRLRELVEQGELAELSS